MLNEIKKHLRVYAQLCKNSLMRQMEYRANFLIELTVESLFMCSKLMYILLVDASGGAAVSTEEMLLYVGTFMLMTAIYTGVMMNNLYGIAWLVKKGDLDMLLTKPLSSQFYVTMRSQSLALPIPNIIAGSLLVAAGWRGMGIEASFGNIALYLLVILDCSMLAYAIILAPMLLSFKIVQMGALIEITDKMWDFNSVPASIYGHWLGRIGLFVLPVLCVTNFPFLTALGRLTALEAVWMALLPPICLVLVSLGWRAAIRGYSSAGG